MDGNGDDLAGAVAVVTGGAGAIGAAVVERLARGGADIAILDVEDPATVVESVAAMGRKVYAARVDVADSAAVRAAVDAAVDVLGAVKIVVNVAGIVDRARLAGLPPRLEDLDEETFDHVVGVNLKGTIFTTRACWSHLVQAGGGSVVNIASVAAFGAGVGAGPAYAASKAGVIGFSQWLARRAGEHGIRVNVVAPGTIQTRLTVPANYPFHRQAIQRAGTTREVADVVHFLASDASSYITGQVLTVDGGQVVGGASFKDLELAGIPAEHA